MNRSAQLSSTWTSVALRVPAPPTQSREADVTCEGQPGFPPFLFQTLTGDRGLGSRVVQPSREGMLRDGE